MPVLAALGVLMCLGACGGPSRSGDGAGSGAGHDGASAAAHGAAGDHPAPAPPAEDAPDGPLPPDALPLHVDLDLTVDPRRERFGGVATLRVLLRRAVDGLWLHGEALNVSGVVYSRPVTSQPRTASWTQVLPGGVSWLGFGETIGPGEVVIEIAYDAAFDRNLAGLFAVEERGDAYALAKSESIQARKFVPGFDEPAYKAPWDVTLTIPAGWTAITNAPEIAREDVGEGLQRVSFATTRPLPTYLLSLAVGPFDVVERPPIPANDVRPRPVPLRGVARRGRGADLEYILDITPEFVRIFEASLGVPYPYAKLDIVAAPQWPSGATELASAISYREQRILADGVPPPAQRRSLIAVHAHELAHMWFGNLVTPPWWDDLWLKEGFASWATPFVLSQWEPEGGHDVVARARILGAMRTDSLASVRRVREDIDANADIRNAYTSIPYRKGMGLIAMADAYFGADEFRRALGRYVQVFADGTADSEDFFAAIGRATATPALTESFRSFVEQPGVPYLRVRLRCDGGPPRVDLSQARYAPLGSSIETDQRWVIPVCLRHPVSGPAGTARTCTLMRAPQATLSLGRTSCPGWVHPNADGAGYYRFEPGTESWRSLLAAFDHLTPAEALVSVDSAVAAFEAGDADAAQLLGVFETAAAHANRLVVEAPMRTLTHYVRDVLEGEDRARLREAASAWYAPRLAALAPPAGEEERLLEQALVRFQATTARDAAVREQLASAAVAFVGVGGEPVPEALDSDRYELALTVAVQDLGAPFFDRLLAFRDTLDDPRFEAASAIALGRSRDAALVARARKLALSGEMGTRETWGMVTAMFESPAGRETAWAWYTTHFDTLLTRIPAQWRRRTPRAGEHFCREEDARRVAAFFADVGGRVPGHERALAQTLEQIRLCAALREQRAADLSEALAGL